MEIIATSTRNNVYYKLLYDEEYVELSRQDLTDFVDTDVSFIYDGKKMDINDYLGDSVCFSARAARSSYNPF
ncbi:hypothetical protein ACOTWR_11680 [Aliarcobacter butzleri]|uniref:hypothetical protein n=1 Tax=Aliarcobacter butzleri TaxID=28197 RepID=UPI0021B22809|nr:hypothetical protein [Aliarcobacter butzleri]MCT7563340.1 hypothetical protein [Aliarcobacter butzleri]MCT7580226.1 hypothetical protein [Aliarcobacter butzleri]